MHNRPAPVRRGVAVIRSCVLPLAIAFVPAARAQTDARPIFPQRIVVTPDTIWFVPTAADVQDDASRRALGYVIPTEEWIESRLARARIPAARTRGRPIEAGTERPGAHVAAPLREGVDLLHVADTVVQRAKGWPGRVYAVRVASTGRVTRLLVPRRWQPRSASRPGEVVSPAGDYATDIADWLATDDEIWFGLWAGPSYVEELGALRGNPPARWKGGILRYTVSSGTVTPLLHVALEDHVVTGLAVSGGMLWVATDRYDYTTADARATTGLLGYRLSDHQWTQFTSGYSPLPGNSIRALAASGDHLAILTDSGAAVLRTPDARWSVRHFAESVRNDSLVWLASAERQAPDSVLRAARRLAAWLGETDLSAFVAAARHARLQPLVSVLAAREDPGAHDVTGAPLPFNGVLEPASHALADPAFLPFLLRALVRSDGETRTLASEALLRDPDPHVQAVVRAILDTGSFDIGIHMAGRLAARGDASAARWLVARAADPAIRADSARRFEGESRMSRLDTLVETIVVLGDSTVSHVLLGLLDSHAAARAMRGVVLAGAFTDQRRLADSIVRRPRLWAIYLDQFIPAYSGAESPPALPLVNDAHVRSIAVRIARMLAAARDGALRQAGVSDAEQRRRGRISAAEVLVRFGQAPAVPYLIQLLDRPDLDARLAAESLVRLTGVATGPGVREAYPGVKERQLLQSFWAGWWKHYGERFRNVTIEEGNGALAEWRRLAGVSQRN